MSASAIAPAITGVHPYAEEFPLASEEELQELAESVATVGLIHPLVIAGTVAGIEDGRLADGRNRKAACESAGVEPTVEVRDFETDDELKEFIIGVNTTGRRDSMTVQIAAASTALILGKGKRVNGQWDNKGGRGNKKSLPESGDFSRKTWTNNMTQAGLILDILGPDALRAVRDNPTKTLNGVYEDAIEERDRERNKLERAEREAAEEADAEAFVKENAPDLADRVDGKDLHSYVEARDIWSRRNREEAAELRRKQEQERKAKEAEEQTYRKQVADASQALRMIDILCFPEQQQFTLDAIKRYPDALTRDSIQLHTPEHLRRLASGLNAYADLLEDHNA